MSPPVNANLVKLQAWANDAHGIEEMAYCPAEDREVSQDDAAIVAFALIQGFESGEDATESP